MRPRLWPSAFARRFRPSHDSGVSGEVLVADNGSTDGSQQIARDEGARVVDVPVRGYGAALIAGHRGGAAAST